MTRNTSEAWGVVLAGSLHLTQVFSPVKWVTGPVSRRDPGHRCAKVLGSLCSKKCVMGEHHRRPSVGRGGNDREWLRLLLSPGGGERRREARIVNWAWSRGHYTRSPWKGRFRPSCPRTSFHVKEPRSPTAHRNLRPKSSQAPISLLGGYRFGALCLPWDWPMTS